ncbi:MAG: hypothetical protein AAF862_08040 [Pseudomonadota bacterium]
MPTGITSFYQPQSVTVVQNGATRGVFKAGQHADAAGFGFKDWVDTLNPLHHIPVVGQLYRAISGDEIADKPRLVGGGLFAGPIGVGIAAATIALRGNETVDRAEANQLAPPDDSGARTNPKNPKQTAVTSDVPDAYEDLSKPYWSAATLGPLLVALNLAAPDEPKAETLVESGNSDVMTSAAPVAKVSPAQPLDIPPINNAFLAQMLSNLDKYEAQVVPTR